MQTTNINYRYNSPSFGRFLKIEGKTKTIQKFHKELKNKDEDFLSIVKQKGDGRSFLYIFSGRHLDEFLNLVGKIYFRDLRTTPEKYLKDKPEKINLNKAEKIKNIFEANI